MNIQIQKELRNMFKNISEILKHKNIMPLDEIKFELKHFIFKITVEDSIGNIYVEEYVYRRKRFSFTVGGNVGIQRLNFFNVDNKLIGTFPFNVVVKTVLEEDNGIFKYLFNIAYYTMIHTVTNAALFSSDNELESILYKGKVYKFFVRWLRDHVHVLKGMKYFEYDLKSGLELYKDSQRADGMIWDNVAYTSGEKNFWDFRLGAIGFLKNEGKVQFKRIPVEADVEYLYVEGIYNVWRATGDDEWLKKMLKSADKALHYSLTNSYRWSKKFKLIKRGFTIDTWDFQHPEDAAITGDPMIIDGQKSRFGIMQ